MWEWLGFSSHVLDTSKSLEIDEVMSLLMESILADSERRPDLSECEQRYLVTCAPKQCQWKGYSHSIKHVVLGHVSHKCLLVLAEEVSACSLQQEVTALDRFFEWRSCLRSNGRSLAPPPLVTLRARTWAAWRAGSCWCCTGARPAQRRTWRREWAERRREGISESECYPWTATTRLGGMMEAKSG